MKRTLLFIACVLASMSMPAQEYYPEGTKWTEIRLDTLKYDSWYSKVGDEWVPNFETIEYYLKGEFIDKSRGDGKDKYKCVYTNGPEWTDSLTLFLQEEGDADYVGHDYIMVSVPIQYYDWNDNLTNGALWPGTAYQFDWSVGKGIYYEDILYSNTTGIPRYYCYYGIIDEIKEGDFGGVRPLKYVDLDGKAPECGKWDNPQNVDTQGGRIIQGIGITEWNDGECLFGAPRPYGVQEGSYEERHYRSMLVHFERNGEVLYDVWPDSLQTDQEGHTNDSDYIPFVEKGKQWTYSYSNMAGNIYDITRVVDGDTIIAGLAYKKIYDKIGGNYQYALREDGKQVYIVHDHYETPQLLYDFSKDNGDIITKEVDEKSGLVSEMRVIGVDTIDIDGLKIRRLQIWKEVYNIQNPIDWEKVEVPWQMASYWIEGVGSECLLETSFREEGNYYNLKSCQINGRTYSQQVLLQEPSKPQNDYLPFVEKGKQWHVVSATPYYMPDYHFVTYWMNEKEERDGKTYLRMYRSEDNKDVVYDAGLFREENRRVYKYDETAGREFMLYDFSLKEGDTFTYEFDPGYPENCKVLKRGWLEDGPEIVSSRALTSADTLNTKYRRLRTWTIGCDNGTGEYNELITWVECAGTLEQLFCPSCTGGVSRLAYLERNETDYLENEYLPFSFCSIYGASTHVHGSNLPTGAEDFSEDRRHHLTYELEGDRLHVYGKVFSNCGPNHYAYFYEKPTDDPLVHKIEFEIQEVEPLADCMALHTTDFYVPGFDPNMNYTVVDNNGEEHPVINKTPQNEYRPFIEDGKVWIISAISDIDAETTLEWTDCCYFDGDSIIDGHKCKLMKLVTNVDENNWVNGVFTPANRFQEYIGAFYEQDKKVYFAKKNKQQFKLLYDFTLSSNDSIYSGGYLLVAQKLSGGIVGFKGTYYNLWHDGRLVERWFEGIGSDSWPYVNHPFEYIGGGGCLLACIVGDEVIYYSGTNEHPYIINAPKGRFDFTHIVKDKPKAPKRRGDETSLYGEYNEHQLGINLDPIDDAYLVRIINESGKVVYEKAVDAGSIVALNIDISAYLKGRYTIIVENSQESFTGEFDTQTMGIVEVKSKKLLVRDGICNLQGQRISTLQKGLNIVNGRKVMVK